MMNRLSPRSECLVRRLCGWYHLDPAGVRFFRVENLFRSLISSLSSASAFLPLFSEIVHVVIQMLGRVFQEGKRGSLGTFVPSEAAQRLQSSSLIYW
jgi:hypothetical protein